MVDSEHFTADWAARGFICELWVDPPGQRWEDFKHATDELVIVLEGEMEFEIEGDVRHPQPGEEDSCWGNSLGAQYWLDDGTLVVWIFKRVSWRLAP